MGALAAASQYEKYKISNMLRDSEHVRYPTMLVTGKDDAIDRGALEAKARAAIAAANRKRSKK